MRSKIYMTSGNCFCALKLILKLNAISVGLIFHSIILINLKVLLLIGKICLGRSPNLLEKMPLSVSVFIGFRLPGPVRQRGVDNRSQDSWERPVNCPVWHLYFVFRNVLHLTPQSSTLFYQIHWNLLSSHKHSSINKTNLYRKALKSKVNGNYVSKIKSTLRRSFWKIMFMKN